MASFTSGQEEPNSALWLAIRASKMEPSIRSVLPALCHARKRCSYTILQINTHKKERGQHSVILTNCSKITARRKWAWADHYLQPLIYNHISRITTVLENTHFYFNFSLKYHILMVRYILNIVLYCSSFSLGGNPPHDLQITSGEQRPRRNSCRFPSEHG